jgi:taurine dioxygenase
MSAIANVLKPPPLAIQRFDLKPLGPRFVAAIEGINLSQAQSDDAIASLRAALVRHKLLLFRGQTLSPRQQRDFAARFGALHEHPLIENHLDQPEIIVVEYDRDRPLNDSTWHTDVTFIETPPLGSILHAVVLPENGGDTIFADLAAAFASLSTPLRALLSRLRARHDFAKSFERDEFPTPEYRAKWDKTRETYPPVSHPVVRTHPESGEKALFVNEGFTRSIEGLAPEESRILLDFLFTHSRRPEFTYRHRWQTGDVLFWDNRITQHYAVADYWPSRRRMHRATIVGDRPA